MHILVTAFPETLVCQVQLNDFVAVFVWDEAKFSLFNFHHRSHSQSFFANRIFHQHISLATHQNLMRANRRHLGADACTYKRETPTSRMTHTRLMCVFFINIYFFRFALCVCVIITWIMHECVCICKQCCEAKFSYIRSQQVFNALHSCGLNESFREYLRGAGLIMDGAPGLMMMPGSLAN